LINDGSCQGIVKILDNRLLVGINSLPQPTVSVLSVAFFNLFAFASSRDFSTFSASAQSDF